MLYFFEIAQKCAIFSSLGGDEGSRVKKPFYGYRCLAVTRVKKESQRFKFEWTIGNR